MQNEDHMRVRTLTLCAWFGLLANIALFTLAPRGWAWGFLVGTTLSLFSAVSLIIIVPFLFQPGANERTKGLLTVTLFMKIPLYMVGLYLGTNVKGVEPIAMMFGIALVPTVITLRAVRSAIQDAAQHRTRHPKRAIKHAVSENRTPSRTNAQKLGTALRERG